MEIRELLGNTVVGFEVRKSFLLEKDKVKEQCEKIKGVCKSCPVADKCAEMFYRPVDFVPLSKLIKGLCDKKDYVK